jgi:tetratricopeptide (TPR) repeat protein
MVNFQPDDFGEESVKPAPEKMADRAIDPVDEEIQVELFPEFPRQRLRRLLKPRTILLSLLTVVVVLGIYAVFIVQRLSSDQYITNGDRLMEQGDYAAAAGYYQQAVQVGPQNPEAYERLGWAEYQQARDEDALGYFEHALSLSPDRALSLYGAGLSAYQLRDYEASISYLTHLIEIEPTHAAGYEYLGLAEYRLAQYETAARHLTRAYIYNPQNATVVYYLGRIHSLSGEDGLAIQSFNEAEALGFDSGSVSYARGFAYLQTGEYESALVDLQKGSSLYPTRKEVTLSLARAFYLLAEYDAAKDQLAGIQADVPAGLQADFLALSGWVSLRQGYTDAARDAFNRWLNLDPNDPDALNALGWAAYYAGDCATASFYFESAVQALNGEWTFSNDLLHTAQETPEIGLTSPCQDG